MATAVLAMASPAVERVHVQFAFAAAAALVNLATRMRRVAWLAEDVQRHSYDGRIVPILTCPGASLQHIAAGGDVQPLKGMT